ncbi:flippase-like domain-containing protein [Ectothiorhodospiraceae bacterium WFHF3C12]|nr:flippase-like domain-containing protein [Ectothiorhodospiraceae bacterium WFHF3C12]
MTRWLKAALAIGLAVGLVWAIDYWLGWDRLFAPWLRLHPGSLALALAVALGSHGLRAVRFQRFFIQTRGVGLQHALQLVLRHNLLNVLLPLRSGEVSFPVLARRGYGIELGEAVGGLLVFRLFDLHTIAWLAAVALYAATGVVAWLLIAALLLPLPVLAWWLADRLYPLTRRLPARAAGLMASVYRGIPGHGGALGEVWGWTIAVWLGKLAAFAWLLTRFGDIDFGRAWLGATAGDITSVLPIHGWAGAGTYEAGVVAALTPLGVDAAAALAMAVNLHLFILGTTLLGGMIAFLVPARRHATTPAPGAETRER